MTQRALRVAIVDDDVSVRRALVRVLRTSELEADSFGSAGELLAALERQHFNCLVVDLQMPDVNGLELQRHLRRSGIEIPLVFITAFAEPGIREQCEAAGAFAFLTKPFESSALIRTVVAAAATQRSLP